MRPTHSLSSLVLDNLPQHSIASDFPYGTLVRFSENEMLNATEVKKKLKTLTMAVEILSPAIGVTVSSHSPPTGTEFRLKQMKTILRKCVVLSV